MSELSKITKTIRDAVLPVKNMGGISIMSVTGLSKLPQEEWDSRVRGADRYLPLWPKAGMRNQLAKQGYCIGFVSPTAPINPMSDNDHVDDPKLADPYVLMGSYYWFKMVNIVPIVAKDEINAYAYNLMCKAVSYSIDKAGDSGAVTVGNTVRAECRELAVERLMNKAPVAVSFHDVVVDLANEIILCDTSSPVILDRIKETFFHIISGRFCAGSSGIIDTVNENIEHKSLEVLPSLILERGMFPDLEGKTIGVESYEKVFKKIFKKQDISEINSILEVLKDEKGDGLADHMAEEDSDGFTNIAAGLVLSTVLEPFVEEIVEWGREYAKKEKGESGVRAGAICDAISVLSDHMADADVIPAVVRIGLKETGGTSLTYTFENKDIPLSIITESYTTICRILAGINTLARPSTKDDIPGATRLASVVFTVTLGEYDVKLSLTKKGFKLVSIYPGSKYTGLVPMEIGVNFIDITERIENTVDVYSLLEQHLPCLSVYSSIYSYLVGVLHDMSNKHAVQKD